MRGATNAGITHANHKNTVNFTGGEKMLLLVPTIVGIGIWFLPETFWDKLQNFKQLRFKHKLTIVGRGKAAWEWVQTGEGQWPEYKFYGELLRELQRLSKLFGATPAASLERIKRPLLQDLRFETKLREIRLSGLSQFFAMALMTWTFMVMSRLILDRSFETGLCVTILMLQILGTAIYLLLEGRLRAKTFKGYDSAYEGLVTLQALIPLGLSLKEKREKSGVDRFLSKQKLSAELERVRRSLTTLLTQWKDFGRPIEAALVDLVDDIRFAQEVAQERLLKQMNAIKFFIAALFFLSAYLLDLLAMVQSLFSVE